MEEIYKNVLLLVNYLTQLPERSYEFIEEPTEAKVREIVASVDKCENKFLKVKEEIVKMISEAEIEQDDIEIKAVLTDNGYLIKEK